MLLSNLQSKDIINMVDGKRVGTIIDINIDEAGHISEVIVQKRRFIFFSGGTVGVKWSEIDKIGKDVILISVKS